MGNIINKVKHVTKNYINYLKYNKYYKISSKNKNGIIADIIRLTHSIEKGLSLENVKLGFGHQKQKRIMELVSKVENCDEHYCKEAIKMAVNAISEYLKYHKDKNYSDDFFVELEKFVNNHKSYLQNNYGGVKKLNKKDLIFNIEQIEHFFETRHSIRNFDSKTVDKSMIKKAIKLAQTCPSACNRQGYRCYVIDRDNVDYLKQWLSGIGGFSDNLDKIIIITGKTSSYRYDENYQYIVSASIFAAYLSLTLHLYGIGSCLIQRPVVWNKEWEIIRSKYNIEKDEQIVLCLGIGNLKDKTVVPVSHRISIDEIGKFI